MKTEQRKALAKELDKNGEVEFTFDGTTYTIWETEQGEDNVRGEDYMNYMISTYDAVEYAELGDDADEWDGGLCTGTPLDAVEFLL